MRQHIDTPQPYDCRIITGANVHCSLLHHMHWCISQLQLPISHVGFCENSTFVARLLFYLHWAVLITTRVLGHLMSTNGLCVFLHDLQCRQIISFVFFLITDTSNLSSIVSNGTTTIITTITYSTLFTLHFSLLLLLLLCGFMTIQYLRFLCQLVFVLRFRVDYLSFICSWCFLWWCTA